MENNVWIFIVLVITLLVVSVLAAKHIVSNESFRGKDTSNADTFMVSSSIEVFKWLTSQENNTNSISSNNNYHDHDTTATATTTTTTTTNDNKVGVSSSPSPKHLQPSSLVPNNNTSKQHKGNKVNNFLKIKE